MINGDVLNALNEQLYVELDSAYVYLGMASYCASANFPGFAAWLKMQAQEELGHAGRICKYIEDRQAGLSLKAINAPKQQFSSPLEVFEEGLKHEESVTRHVYQVYETAHAAKDWATQAFLEWFITEQVEEEKTFADVVAMIKMIDGDPHALMMLNDKLGMRAGCGGMSGGSSSAKSSASQSGGSSSGSQGSSGTSGGASSGSSGA